MKKFNIDNYKNEELDKIELPDFNAMSKQEFDELQVKLKNQIIGDLNEKDGIECSKCLNRGYITILDGIYEQSVECECMKKRKVILKAKNSGLGEYVNKKSKDYIVSEEWQKVNKELVVEYCSNKNQENWFILCGQSGSGKTLLGSIIANNFLNNLNKDIIYITWTDFIKKIKLDIMSDKALESSKTLNEIKNIEVLFIDELLKKYNDTDLNYIIEIINYRYTNNLITIITSENTIDKLLDIDEATFGRVIEKCGKYIINIEQDRSKNYRLKFLNRGE